jgi:hypothetical protein
MAIKTGEYSNTKDVYMDYSFEDVMFRCMKKYGASYRKFYGEKESLEQISHDNSLFNNALLYGEEITKEEYDVGKKG